MSLDDYEQILGIAERYCSRKTAYDREAFAIDSIADFEEESQSQDQFWSVADSKKGIRRHLKTDASDCSESRAKTLRAWIEAGRTRISRCRNLHLTLMPPIQYVGYAVNATNRRRGHESRNSVSWLSLLTTDICQHLWPDKYSLKFFVICLIRDQQLGQFAEIILSRCLRA